jgi:predicted DNA-binding protein
MGDTMTLSLADKELEKEIASLADMTGISKSTITRNALREYLTNHKAYFMAVAAHHEAKSYTPIEERLKRRGLES